ncbi:hypothetical protein BJ944DRAFT_170888, partial [Cunninghamella echinulata]
MEKNNNTSLPLLRPKVAIITGVNYGGLGFGITQRLLELLPKDQSLTIIFACRNYTRASKVRDYFIKKQYEWIDYLFLNAGHLSALGLNWRLIFSLFFKHPIRLMESSDATIQCRGEINQDGLGKVFASCVFGHYVMMRQLESLLSNSIDGSRVIWTSSSTALNELFDINDWQGIKSELPYESSKWACDLLAVASNDYFQQHQLNITSFTTSPAVVASRIGNLPLWIIYLR